MIYRKRRFLNAACRLAVAGLAMSLLALEPAAAQETDAAGETTTERWSKETKLLLLRGGIVGAIVGYGILNWQKKDRPEFEFLDDGWFEAGSQNAGADKTGHVLSTYIASRIFSAAYRKLDVEDGRADWQGPLSAWSAMVLVEFTDAFQQYGFSIKDIAANSVGALIAFAEERYESLDEKVDFRIEYIPSEAFLRSGETDILSDYSGMRHLAVLKLSGFDGLKPSPLSFVELHAGYFTKGTAYARGLEKQTRNLFAGISLNFSMIFEKAGNRSEKFKKPLHATTTFLNYYQLPYVSLDAVKTLD